MEALLKYEAGFPDCKEGQHIRLVIVSGKDGCNCKYFLNTLVGTYFAILPPYGGTRPFDIYNGNKKLLEHEILQGNLTWLILFVCSHGGNRTLFARVWSQDLEWSAFPKRNAFLQRIPCWLRARLCESAILRVTISLCWNWNHPLVISAKNPIWIDSGSKCSNPLVASPSLNWTICDKVMNNLLPSCSFAPDAWYALAMYDFLTKHQKELLVSSAPRYYPVEAENIVPYHKQSITSKATYICWVWNKRSTWQLRTSSSQSLGGSSWR